jgi:hypothetical protein
MAPFAVSPPAAHRPGGQVRIYRHNVDFRVPEEPVDGILPGRPEPGLDDDAQFNPDGGGHQPRKGILQVTCDLAGARFTKNDRHGC